MKKYSGLFVFIMAMFILSLPLFIFSLQHQQITKQNASSTRHVYFGTHVLSNPSNLTDLATFETDAKKKVSIDMWYQAWGATDGSQNFQATWMNNVRAHGSIPMVSWMPWNPSNGTPNQASYALRNITNGNFDSYIINWANASKSWGHPYFLRFAFEMNGYWFPWDEEFNGKSINGNAVGDFVKAWRHVVTIFQQQGVTNVTWVWSPNVNFSGTPPLSQLYPGDGYVQWAGIDGYNWGNLNGHTWQTFYQVFYNTYTTITGITGKPLMVTETASTESGGNKANWITNAYSTQIPYNFPKVEGIIWFNENKETDWRIESSTPAKSAFATAIQNTLYTTNTYSALTASPIPTP